MRSRSSSTTTGGDAKRLLLVCEIGVVDRRDACVVSLGKHAPQLGTSRSYPAGNDQCGVAQVDETDLAAVIDTPAPP